MINRELQNWPESDIVIYMNSEIKWPDLSRDAKAMDAAIAELGVPSSTDDLKLVLKRAQEIKQKL